MSAGEVIASGLSPRELSEVFPFHIGFGGDGTVLQVGRALSLLCPKLQVGGDIRAHVRVLRPHGGLDFAVLRAAASEFIVLELAGVPIPLRGQTLALADRMLLLVSPWITDGAQLGQNLRLSDFALHDPALDYLTLLQAKNASLLDAAEMAEKLHSANTELATALAEREVGHARLSGLIALLPSAIIVVDERRRIVLINQRACSLFGVEAASETLLGTELSAWAEAARVRFEDPEQFLRGTSDSSRAEIGVGEVLELRDGRVFERDYVPITDAAGMRGHLLQYRDVSENRRVQRELCAARVRAEDASAAKSAFLAMISHEMRTPLGVIVGLTELLSQPRPQAEHDEFLQRLHANAHSLSSIIEDVLDFSRLESGKMRFRDVSFDPMQVVTEVAQALAPTALAKGVELVADIDERVPSSVHGDPARLRQLLVNLVANAVKFTERGEIVVSIECLEATAEKALLRYSVQDTGCGIPQELHEQIFERFVRADSSAARAHGTGLGLSISALLARGMGAKISLESEPKVGSRFAFDVDHRVDALAAHAPPALRDLRVAVIDPLVPARRAIARLLRRLGAEVIEAHSHEEIRVSSDAPIHTIICDDSRSLNDAERVRQRSIALEALAPECVVLRSPAALAPIALQNVTSVVKPLSHENLLRVLSGTMTRRLHSIMPLPAAGSKCDPQTSRVLIVDDDRDNQIVIKSLVQQHGNVLVDVASDGASALRLLDTGVYDLVLTDLQMPVLDGFELARRIRNGPADSANRDVPIVAVSAHALPEFVRLAVGAGMNEFIAKPIDVPRLRKVLDRWLDPRPRVLVVDDCEDALLVTLRQLDSIGAVASVAVNNGATALERIARGDIDIVLLDMGMPGMDGCSVVRAIRALPDLPQPQVVALTGHHAADQVQRFMEAGCDHHLVKPARISVLRELLSRLTAKIVRPSPHNLSTPEPAPANGTTIDRDLLDMIPGYIANRRGDVAKLKELLDSAAPLSEVRQLGHRMKGTGAAYGFPRITELGAALETESQSQDRPVLRALVEQLERYLEDIEQMLGRPGCSEIAASG